MSDLLACVVWILVVACTATAIVTAVFIAMIFVVAVLLTVIDVFRSWFRRFWRKHIVDDVPPEIDACESCRELHCDERMASECQLRRAAIEAAKKRT